MEILSGNPTFQSNTHPSIVGGINLLLGVALPCRIGTIAYSLCKKFLDSHPAPLCTLVSLPAVFAVVFPEGAQLVKSRRG